MYWTKIFIVLVVAMTNALAIADQQDAEKLEYFEKQIRPILVGHCNHCHSAETKPAGGLRVDDHNGLLTGGNSGPAIVPGNSDNSTLIARVRGEGKKRMPPEGDPLDGEEIEKLIRWINDGAIWPALAISEEIGYQPPEYDKLKAEHWSWQPLSKSGAPAIEGDQWSKSDIDRFVYAKLEAKNLKPAADAEKLELIRRITFDLTGLPPTPDEIDQFLADDRQNSFEAVVDRLLDSKSFGEHWGRHWLDVARYAESTGPSRNIPYPHAWRYRDYVIDAVNTDIPFDRFVREQVAGDLMPASDDAEANRLLTATGFLALGTKDVNQRFRPRFIMDNVDEQVDVVTRSVLGLTVSCARCHDHKFDPVPAADYYALAGIFTSTENAAGLRNQMGGSGLAYYVPKQLVSLRGDLPAADPAKVEALTAQVEEAKAKWDAIRGTAEGLKKRENGQPFQRKFRLEYDKKQAELNALTDPAQLGLATHGVRDAAVIEDCAIRIRGEAELIGPVVPRGFLSAFEVKDAQPVSSEQSGRLELAQWLTSKSNPLSQRVAVNRVWSNLFGRGIVSTVDNFGVTGDKPTHPELLDYLAETFTADGWSIKRLIRRIVTSRTYQLSSKSSEEALAIDPANKYLWRHAPKRLSAEAVRDAILASAGSLDQKRPGASFVSDWQMREIRDNGPEAKQVYEYGNSVTFRSVYLPLLRGLAPKSLEVFDPVEQTLVSGTRNSTTVPSQALFLLNSTFVRKHALSLAEDLLSRTDLETDSSRVASAYRLILGREPSVTESERSIAFINEFVSVLEPESINETQVQEADLVAVADDPNIVDPDQADQTGVTISEADVRVDEPQFAAWLAFIQALYGTAEFRYLF